LLGLLSNDGWHPIGVCNASSAAKTAGTNAKPSQVDLDMPPIAHIDDGIAMIPMKIMWVPLPSQVFIAPRNWFTKTSKTSQNLLPMMMMWHQGLKASSFMTSQY
jgi:hypothetical protein